MNLKIILLLIGFVVAAPTWAANDFFLSYIIAGSLSTSENYRDEITINFDQELSWKTSGTLSGFDPGECENQAGEFQSKVTLQEHQKIVEAGIAAAKSLPANNSAPPERGVSKRIKVIRNDDSFSANLAPSAEITKEWKAFEQLINEVKEKLMPKKIVTLNSRQTKPSVVQLRFNYYGKEPFGLLLPSDPNLAFYANGFKVEYLNKFSGEVVYLDSGKKELDISLKLVPLDPRSKYSKITYSNKRAMHHAEMDFMKNKIRPAEMNICSTIKI